VGADRNLLLEREPELRAIKRLLRDGRAGAGGLLLVQGPAGVGKTALIKAARRLASGGEVVLAARGAELEREFPFGIVRQLFERLLVDAGAAERERLLSGAASHAARLFSDAAFEQAEEDLAFATVHGLYWLVAHLSERAPLVMLVDDIHWADQPSLGFLAYLGRRLDGLSVALIAALRTDEPDAPARLLDDLRDEAGSVQRPQPLTEDAAGTLVRASLGRGAEREFVRACWQATGGNPFLLEELVRAAVVTGVQGEGTASDRVADLAAAGVARQVSSRVERLGPGALKVARALTILGESQSLPRISKLSGVDHDVAAEAIRALAAFEILESEGRPAFIHPLVRSSIYGELSAVERDRLHRAAAWLLHAEEVPPEEVAAHLLAARPAADPWTVERLRDAAALALGRGAPESAATYLERALAEEPEPALRTDVLEQLAVAEEWAGRGSSIEHLRLALQGAREPGRRARLALRLGATLGTLFKNDEAVDVLERAIEELGDADPELVERLRAELIATSIFYPSTLAKGLEHLELASPGGPAAPTVAAMRAALVFLTGGPGEQIEAYGLQALSAGGLLSGSLSPGIHAIPYWVMALGERFDAVEASLQRELSPIRASGRVRGLITMEGALAITAWMLGDLTVAEAHATSHAELYLERARDRRLVQGLTYAAWILTEVLVEQGNLLEAEAAIAMLPEPPWPLEIGWALAHLARGRLRCAQGDWQAGLVDLLECGNRYSLQAWGLERPGSLAPSLPWRSRAAEAQFRLGNPDEAHRLALAEVDDLRQAGLPRALGVALRAAGTISDEPERTELLRQSVAVLESSPAALERAKSLIELGAALRRGNRRSQAREHLASGLELAHRCGAEAVVRRARDELHAAGARPRRIMRSGLEALTTSELRVTRLAAEGRSNLEIAQELFLSLKTVESHLSRAYSKLDLSGRGARGGLAEVLTGRAPEKSSG
jgi:DNA-binding CsgD family transcriptional regulator